MIIERYTTNIDTNLWISITQKKLNNLHFRFNFNSTRRKNFFLQQFAPMLSHLRQNFLSAPQ
jgi:hypothetical protein